MTLDRHGCISPGSRAYDVVLLLASHTACTRLPKKINCSLLLH